MNNNNLNSNSFVARDPYESQGSSFVVGSSASYYDPLRQADLSDVVDLLMPDGSSYTG